MTKKILSIALILVMMFSLAVPAFAADVPDAVYSAALEEAEKEFLANDVSEILSAAGKVTTATLKSSASGADTYSVSITTAFIYVYTCEVIYYASSDVTIVTKGDVTIIESVGLFVLSEIYEFFLEFLSAINDLLSF